MKNYKKKKKVHKTINRKLKTEQHDPTKKKKKWEDKLGCFWRISKSCPIFGTHCFSLLKCFSWKKCPSVMFVFSFLPIFQSICYLKSIPFTSLLFSNRSYIINQLQYWTNLCAFKHIGLHFILSLIGYKFQSLFY